jgi:uncharacterized protein YkwD
MERAVLQLVNQVRVSRGLPRVSFAWPLQTRSRNYAGRLLRSGRFEHSHLPPNSRENLAWATTNIASARQIVRMWMRSPGHRATLLWGPARRAGVGIVRGRYRGYPDVRVAVLRFRIARG